MSAIPETEVLREWRDSAHFWKKHAQTIQLMFAPVTRALIEDAGIRQGDKVLDVAGGPGEPSLTIAELVGPNGKVMCTDAIPAMVAAAENEAQRRGLTNVEFLNCTGESLPFDENQFDAAVSRLGVMFFPDPLAGLREMLRVTRTGGRVSLVVWASSELNPFLNIVTNVMTRYFEPASSTQKASDAFTFAEPGKLAAILREAGADPVSERMLKFQIEAPISRAEFWELRSETSGTLREKLKMLSDKERQQAAREVQEASRRYFTNLGMSFPAQMIIATGAKPDRNMK
jgi:ubiquinone/menaquinone biosynthesis C-methylase UbiE